MSAAECTMAVRWPPLGPPMAVATTMRRRRRGHRCAQRPEIERSVLIFVLWQICPVVVIVAVGVGHREAAAHDVVLVPACLLLARG